MANLLASRETLPTIGFASAALATVLAAVALFPDQPAPRGALADLLPVVPTTVRDFAADDEVHGFVQVVQGGKHPPSSVRLDIEIVSARDETVHRAADTLEAAMFAAARSADYGFAVPIESLVPGPYVLTIDAQAGNRTTRRHIRFTRR